ncbi:carboxypeptidase regulatory-like domain-containing protein [Hymenobacter persicinus]|uniref:Carboxypeptidase regulatory-like domain-containing protein n=1 Tax=Hymenobacter persicinus TaxID=2025506 RepID=A0A4Q5LCW9_9BACT|nr:carboxypeptidase regulatory-like domain-containing protein [Hymenobacter persicinus]RYU78056.1 hypothetical protein EWM57_15565 [Hymenobacter persicinus]
MKMSSIFRALAVFSLLLISALSSQAQSTRCGTLTGRLLDASTHEAIPNTTIVLLRASDNALVSTATTRADGSFRVANVPFGQYCFRTTVLGYRAQQPRVAFHAKQTSVALGTLALQPLGTQLAAVLASPQGLLAVAR